MLGTFLFLVSFPDRLVLSEARIGRSSILGVELWKFKAHFQVGREFSICVGSTDRDRPAAYDDIASVSLTSVQFMDYFYTYAKCVG